MKTCSLCLVETLDPSIRGLILIWTVTHHLVIIVHTAHSPHRIRPINKYLVKVFTLLIFNWLIIVDTILYLLGLYTFIRKCWMKCCKRWYWQMQIPFFTVLQMILLLWKARVCRLLWIIMLTVFQIKVLLFYSVSQIIWFAAAKAK